MEFKDILCFTNITVGRQISHTKNLAALTGSNDSSLVGSPKLL